ncbi:MAG: hypothetical protein KDA95_11545, partial [Acidimicrobiales bacterium]|nr:hypothetical protein [Acidimicrobiales bacterium]
LGVVLGAAPLGGSLINGRWRTPTNDYSVALNDLLSDQSDGPYRVLWLGDPDQIPVRGWRYDNHLAYGTSDDGPPTIKDRFVVPDSGATPLLAEALRAGEQHRTSRVGRLLAPMGVRYVIVQNQLAPSGSEVATAEGTLPMLDVLAQQLDLERVPVTDGLTIYRNSAWIPMRAVLPETESAGVSWTDAVGDDLTAGEPALKNGSGPTSASGSVPKEGDLLVSGTSDPRWQVKINGVALGQSKAYGWSNMFEATTTGPARLSYDTSLSHRAMSVGQVLLWCLALVAWRRSRSRASILEMEPIEPAVDSMPKQDVGVEVSETPQPEVDPLDEIFTPERDQGEDTD